MKPRKAYIAKYPLNSKGNDLDEVILFSDTYWSEMLRHEWNKLVEVRKPSDPMLQAWYSDENLVTCVATTNQPFKLS